MPVTAVAMLLDFPIVNFQFLQCSNAHFFLFCYLFPYNVLFDAVGILHHIRVIQSGIMFRTAKPLYMVYKTTETGSSSPIWVVCSVEVML